MCLGARAISSGTSCVLPPAHFRNGRAPVEGVADSPFEDPGFEDAPLGDAPPSRVPRAVDSRPVERREAMAEGSVRRRGRGITLGRWAELYPLRPWPGE